MATSSKKTKTEPPKAISALTVYRQHGNTLAALKQALQHGLDNKEKDLAKTFQKQLFQAAGQDQYRLHLHDSNDLNAVLRLSLALVDKIDKPQDWLELLEQADYWDAVRLTRITPLLNKAVARLATHIPKARNPANEGAPKFTKIPCEDLSVIPASAASLATATIEGDATLVGVRFFFEFVFYFAGTPTSVLTMLLDKDPKLSAFLQQIGLDDTTFNQWHSKANQLPKELSPLHAQLLFKTSDGQTLSITPMLSVAASSWLGQWRKETLFIEDQNEEGNRPLFNIEAAEYGGTNARNIASIMMDFSGRQQHPKILPPPVRRDVPDRLIRLLHRPSELIKVKKLQGNILGKLAQTYPHFNNDQTTQYLIHLIEDLLDDLLEDITLIRSLLNSQHEESLDFQAEFDGLPKRHRHLHFLQGIATDEEIKSIANDITQAWLGLVQEFKGGGERYKKITDLLIEQLHSYMIQEASV